MQHVRYPEEMRQDAIARTVRSVIVGIDTRYCPACGNPLSFDLSGNPFCRHCHRNRKASIRRFSRRYEITQQD